ncbi:MAG TPA: type VI secretion system tip protein TssI/VgrG, partial [Candidatus Polarisedimenticolia bacterium]|nr:type VI secretion system tip protein TssI/VgrG [Candidatus Polarisedimenticolia bacterium]
MTPRAPALAVLLLSLSLAPAAAAATPDVTTPVGAAFTVEGFRGEEAASRLFSFDLDLAAPRGTPVPFDAMLGGDVTLTMPMADGTVRHFNGIVSRFSAGDTDTTAHYHLTMVPKAWLLTRRQTSRIFQDMAVPQIVAQILRSVPGLAFEMRLTGGYPPRDYCVQYRESDFDFVSRLLEEEGIYFYFRHDAGGHTMVLADTPQGSADLPGVHLYRRGTLLLPPPPGSITSWEKTQEIRSGQVTLWDYTMETPEENYESIATIQAAVVAGSVEHHLTAGGAAALEQFEYPGGYAQRFDGVDRGGGDQSGELAKIAPEGRRVAGIRMQEEAATALVIRGASLAPDLTAGHLFVLGGHENANGKYFITGVTHTYTLPRLGRGGYSNQFTCLPDTLPYRPARRTPKPALQGTESAVVVGPPGEATFTDKYGRVKVQFHWDRRGRNDENSSCWIRVASPWAGAGVGPGNGPQILPRVGWEVVVSFDGGDPDKPIIIGSVYNADRLPPPPPPPPEY